MRLLPLALWIATNAFATIPLVECLKLDDALVAPDRGPFSVAREAEVRPHLEKLGAVEYLAEGNHSLAFRVKLKTGGDEVIVRVPKDPDTKIAWERLVKAEKDFFDALEGNKDAKPHLKHFARTRATGRLDDGTPYVVSEVAKGKSLFESLRHGSKAFHTETSTKDLISGAKQLATALKVIHGSNKVHLDIKPGNIILEPTAEGVVWRLIDFGLVTEQGTVNPLGTTHYMHGDRLNPGYKVRAVDDIYSMGMVLHELLEGTKQPGGPVAPVDILDNPVLLRQRFNDELANMVRRRKLEEVANRCLRLQIPNGAALLKALEDIP